MANQREARTNASHGELVSLREYVDMRFDAYERANESRFTAQEKAVSAALFSADRAVSKAEASTERRLEGMNEFRNALGDYSRTLMPRPEAEGMIKAVTEKIDALTKRVNAKEERSGGRGDLWGWIVAGIVAMSALFNLFLKLYVPS